MTKEKADPRSPAAHLLWGLCGGALFVLVHAVDPPGTQGLALRLATKAVPLLTLLSWSQRAPGVGRQGRLGGLALLLGMGGDALLELGAQAFVFGLGAFLLGHLAWIGAFLQRDRRWALHLLPPLVGYGLGMAWLLQGHLGELQLPVLIYLTVILAMVWRATAQAESLRGLALLGGLGALLFALSDSLIALNSFVLPLSAVDPVIMATYLGAQLGLTLSLEARPAAPPSPAPPGEARAP
jgi:uncharacterized membrane protein YhhN